MEKRVTNKLPLKDFVDLEVWQAARELRREVYKMALALPEFEKFALASELRRAATSVTAKVTAAPVTRRTYSSAGKPGALCTS